MDPLLLTNLHSWSPNLRELDFFHGPHDQTKPGLRHQFSKLQDVVLRNVSTHDVKEFLRWNPQLKGIKCDNTGKSLFRLVAKHVPTIERLDIQGKQAIFPKNMKYLNKLRSLESLSIWTRAKKKLPAFEPAIDSLEILRLSLFDFRQMGTELTRKLSGFYIYYSKITLSMANLLDVVRYGDALERFSVTTDSLRARPEPVIFDADSYVKMVNMIKSRQTEGMRMCLENYVSNIPETILAEHRNVLDLELKPKYPLFD